MYQRVTSYVPTISIVLFAAILGLHSTQVFAASDCVRVPSHSAAQGRHRHYHVYRGGRCWHTVAEHAAIPSQVETASPPQQPDTLASFFSSITSAFTTVSTPKPDTLNPGVVAQPEPPPRGGNGARKRRRHAGAKRQQRHAEAKRQQRHAGAKRQQRQAEAKPEPPPEVKAKPGGVSLDKANSDALFREYFGRN